jgi:hypothetical protein
MEEAKKQLQKVHFDSNAFISVEMKGLSNATEQQLYELFKKLMDDVEEFSESLEEGVGVLQEAVDTADDILLNELRQHADRLNVVKDSVNEVERNFDRASEGAVRIGSRLAATERERSRIETAMLTLDLVTAFEAIPMSGKEHSQQGCRSRTIQRSSLFDTKLKQRNQHQHIRYYSCPQ